MLAVSKRETISIWDQRDDCSYFHRILILLLETDNSDPSQHMHQHQYDIEQLLVNSRVDVL